MLKYKIQTETQIIEFVTEELANAYNLANFNKYTIEFFNDQPPGVNQYQIDVEKYKKRAAARDTIIAEMAAENMQRVRAGTWTVGQLIALTQDDQLRLVLGDVTSLSYELACQKIAAIANPLITAEIKSNWQIKLASHFYNS